MADGKTGQKVSDDVRDRIRAASSIGGVQIVSLGCGEVLGTHEPTRFNHNGPLYDFKKNTSKYYRIKSLFSALSHAKTVSNGHSDYAVGLPASECARAASSLTKALMQVSSSGS